MHVTTALFLYLKIRSKIKSKVNIASQTIATVKQQIENTYSSFPNRRVARSVRGGEKDEPFVISVVPGISMVARIFRSVTVITRRTK